MILFCVKMRLMAAEVMKIRLVNIKGVPSWEGLGAISLP